MDPSFLDHLVHPLYKTPLKYDQASQMLVDPVHNDRFRIKENVPVLLVAEQSDVVQPLQHQQAGSEFHYKEHYQVDATTYDYFKETENATERGEHDRLHEYILSQIPAGADWVLDTGCGGGWLAKSLRGTNRHVVSMDISDINPIRATKDVPYNTHYGLVADVFELPVRDGSIDCIVASEIIEHVPDPKRFVHALVAALKPGGKLIITTPYNEKIQYSLCIHCNRLTPHNAHLHSFTQASISKLVPVGVRGYKTSVFNNKILVRLGMQRMLKFLPLSIWKAIDNLTNTLTKKRAYRLMLVVEK